MGKSKPQPRSTTIEEVIPLAVVAAPWLTRIAFVLTLAVMIARALMTETVRDAFGMSAGPRGPGPATTMLLNAFLCVPALLVLTRRVIDRQYIVRWTWSHVLLAAFAVWAAISVAWASDRFAAIVAAANLLAAAALVWSTAQLVRSGLRLRIVAGVCFGLLLVYSAHGLIYRFIDSAHHEQFWAENKDEILRQRGWEPDSAIARQFERKFLGRELIGFNESPNSFAAVIVLLTVVTAGVAIQRRASGDAHAWTIAILAACVPGIVVIYFTHSRTAMGTLMIAAATLAALSRPKVRTWLAAHHVLAFWSVVSACALGAAALIAHGVYHGSLPHDSLNFRWRYWIAATELFKQHPFAGVGWANFGPHYLSVRVPAAAEEVRDPHNFIVRAFSELGLVGGILLLLWLGRAAWELTRPIAPAASSAAETPLRSGLAMIVGIITLGVLLASIAAIDFAQNVDYVMLEVFRRVLYLGLLCVGMIVAATRTTPQQEMDDRPAPWVLHAMVLALGLLIIHSMMDFVLGEGGAMTIFAVLLGAASGARMPSAAGARKHRRIAVAALAAAMMIWLAAIVVFVVPIVDAEQQADAGEKALASRNPHLAAGLFESAFRRAPFNADYIWQSAVAALHAGLPPQRIRASFDIAIATDPANAMYYLTRARHELQQPAPDLESVRRDFATALNLDPQNVEIRLEFAALLQRWGDHRAASEQYRCALETNRQYDENEPERLPPQRVREIEGLIKSLES